MKEYEPFVNWYTDIPYRYIIKDRLDYDESHIAIYNPFGDVIGSLTPTDIKRLAECVERWEESRRTQMEISDAGVFCKAAV